MLPPHTYVTTTHTHVAKTRAALRVDDDNDVDIIPVSRVWQQHHQQVGKQQQH